MATRPEQQNPADSGSRSNQVYKHPEPERLPHRIRSLQYPLAPQDAESLKIFERANRHYVKFFINLDEESKLIPTLSDSEVLGYINNTDQNRANRGITNAEAISTTGNVVGTVGGALLGAEVGKRLSAARKTGSAKDNQRLNQFAAKGATVFGAAAGAAIGYALSDKIGEIAIEDFKLTKRLKRLGHTISLYTPAGISASYEMQYENSIADLVNLAQTDTIESIKKAKDDIRGSATKFTRTVLSGVSPDFSMLSRTAINRRKDMLFKGVGNRSFVFDYQFAPRSPEEAKEVEHIIYLFKYFSHPEILEGYGQYLFTYPAEFDIEYYMIEPNGEHKVNPYLNRISSCVLDRVSVAYAPNGSYQSLLQGEPLIINLSLKFTEIEVLHRDRIEKGY